MEKKSVSSRDLRAQYAGNSQKLARGASSGSGTTEGHQNIPRAQEHAHGTVPAPSVTANASNLAAVAEPQPSNGRELHYFYSPDMRAATSGFDIDKFFSDETSMATNSGFGRSASRKNALPDLAGLSDQQPAKKKKLKLPKLSFAKRPSASTESEAAINPKSKFKLNLKFGGSNNSPKRPTHGPVGETPRSPTRQLEQTWHSSRPVDLIETAKARQYALTPRGFEKTFMASVGLDDITASLPHSQELVDHHPSDLTLQSDSVSEGELNHLLAAMHERTGDDPTEDPGVPEKSNH